MSARLAPESPEDGRPDPLPVPNMTRPKAPEITIGLPVYNGARYVSGAIDAILAQTYQDFELVICDNASTDGTQAICERAALADSRVRYVRQPRNLGAAPNFNHCFALARGRYFKWAAHDDLIDPPFLERCLEALERNPDAVLCQSRVRIVDADGACLQIYDPATLDTGRLDPVDRFIGRTKAAWCKEVFGLIRSETLKGTALIGGYPASDEILLAELALLGRFIILPQALFSNREHPDRSTRGARLHPHSPDRQRWFVTGETGRTPLPTWTLYAKHLNLVQRYVPERSRRMRCYIHLLRSLLNSRMISLAVEPLVVHEPRLLPAVDALMNGIRRLRHGSVAPPSPQRK